MKRGTIIVQKLICFRKSVRKNVGHGLLGTARLRGSAREVTKGRGMTGERAEARGIQGAGVRVEVRCFVLKIAGADGAAS